MTTTYILLIKSPKAQASFLLTYKAGNFFRLQRKSGNIGDKKQWNWLMNLVPNKEVDIDALGAKYEHLGISYTRKEAKEPTTAHGKFMAAYIAFYYRIAQTEPRITIVEGKAMKGIIKYLSDMSDKDEALIIWNAILTNWDKLKPYYKEKLELRHINSNITTILIQIKNAIKEANSNGNADGLRESL